MLNRGAAGADAAASLVDNIYYLSLLDHLIIHPLFVIVMMLVNKFYNLIYEYFYIILFPFLV